MDPLDRPARAADLRTLAGAGVLDAATLEDALKSLGKRPDAESWRTWGGRYFALLGACLAGSGAIFFFAANWQAMSRWGRFGLALAVFVATAAFTVRAGLERLAGRALALLSLVLVGPVFAVYGQEWQTGADAFDLFVGWAVLATGFAWASRLELAWSVWLLLVHVATWLWLDQRFGDLEELWLARAAVAAFDVGVVALALRFGFDAYLPRLAATAAVVLTGVPAVLFLGLDDAPREFLSDFGVVVALVGAALAVFRTRRPEFFMVALAGTALATLAGALLFRVLFSGSWDIGAVFLFGLGVAGLAFGLARWLRGEQRRMRDVEEA